jgi:hypothetical protein
MKKHNKVLLLALGLGLSAVTLHATCANLCDNPANSSLPECNPDGNGGPEDSMPEGVIVDDMPTSVFAKE